MERIGVAVIGGGAVGCAVARELAEAGMKDLFLFERLSSVGDVQSGRNSGVVHAGIYYAEGSLKAALCVESNPLMYDFCRRHGVPVENTGKLVVASSPWEVGALEAILEQASANGVPGVRMLTATEIRAFEPNVAGHAALHVPTTGIVDAAGLTRALAEAATNAGGTVLTGFEVVGVTPRAGVFEVTGRRAGREETFEAETVVNAAGLDCDVVARMIDPERHLEAVPLRGEYCRINRRARAELWLNGLNVYPVPVELDLGETRRKMVGVHLTPTFALQRSGSAVLGDTVTVGPEFSPVASRDDYAGGRKPEAFFLERARRFLPDLRLEDLTLDFAGIMVQLRNVSDWIIERDRRHPGCVQLLGIDSPGLTGSLAIARRVRSLLLD